MEGWPRLIGVGSLKSLFDQVLGVYLSEGNERKCVRPFPVLTSNGQSLELFRLYWIVRKIGGYDSVSSKKLWDYVADFCGLDIGAVGFVKLVYVKYLNEFDHWLRQLVIDGNLGGGEGGVIRQLDLLSKELETMFRSSLPHRVQEKKETNVLPSKNGFKEEVICMVNSQVDFEMFTAESVNEINGGEHRIMDNLYNSGERSVSEIEYDTVFLVSTEGIVEKILYPAPAKSNRLDDDEKSFAEDGENNTTSTGVVIQGAVAKMNGMAGKGNNDREKFSILNCYDTTVASGESVIQDVIVSRKRKRESSCFNGVLNWVNSAAKHAIVPEIGEDPNSSMWKGHSSDFRSQVLLIREALLDKSHIDTSTEESNPQKKLRVHPSLYEEKKIDNQPAERQRCSTRVPAPKKHICCRGCSSCPTSQNKAETHQKKEDAIAPDLRSADLVEVPVTEESEDSVDQHPEALVGPLYQAEVPEWTGVISESDSKWLGTRMWPPEVDQPSFLLVHDPVGKGRQGSCACLLPQSVACTRFHIAESRHNLKLELGALFFRWRFNRMGEEVSLSWTAAEEGIFKDSVRSTSKKKLWKNYKKLFPSKTWSMLASYYFNVFLIKRRRYQNRVTPGDLDSDDDEKRFGCIGGSFGANAVHVASSRSSLRCFQNKASTDLV